MCDKCIAKILQEIESRRSEWDGYSVDDRNKAIILTAIQIKGKMRCPMEIPTWEEAYGKGREEARKFYELLQEFSFRMMSKFETKLSEDVHGWDEQAYGLDMLQSLCEHVDRIPALTDSADRKANYVDIANIACFLYGLEKP